jgi:hypothetical protein
MTKADSVHSTPPTNTSANNPPDRRRAPRIRCICRPTFPPKTSSRRWSDSARRQDEIERLLTFLDQTEADPDLEPYMTGYCTGMDDREGGECEDEGADGADDREPNVDDEDDGTGEPSFGWNEEETALGRYPNMMGVQR